MLHFKIKCKWSTQISLVGFAKCVHHLSCITVCEWCVLQQCLSSKMLNVFSPFYIMKEENIFIMTIVVTDSLYPDLLSKCCQMHNCEKNAYIS